MLKPSRPTREGPTPTVEVHEEHATERGWSFRVTVLAPGAGATDLTLTLSWHDYEHWSHGTSAPARVARAVLEAAAEAGALNEPPARVDASTLRRITPGLDDRVRESV